MLDGSRELNCRIAGESIVFLVVMGCDSRVSELKEKIQKKRELGILKDVDPHSLELWKVSAIDKPRCEAASFRPNRSTLISMRILSAT